MKIGLTGPSGSGKTTLANYISGRYGLTFVAGSASLMHSEEAQAFLNEVNGYEPMGHKAVINKSNENPQFGMDFQRLLLESRVDKLSKMDNIITDRTPVDNLTYFMLQCSHNQTETATRAFITKSIRGLISSGLTHLILIKPKQGWTEDNDSRVANNFYQRATYSVFEHVLNDYFTDIALDMGIKILILDMWDLDTRKNKLNSFLGDPA